MLQDIPLPFGEWLPDLGENENPGLVEAKNVIPEPQGYRPVGSLEEVASSTDLGGVKVFTVAQEFRTSSGAWTMLGDTSDTFALQGNGVSAPTVRSRLGTSRYFVQFDDVIYGFNSAAVGGTCKFTPSTATFSTITPAFSGVSAAQIGRFIVRAQPVTSAPFDFGWSAFNNPEDVAISQTTQAGRATVNNSDLGPVVGITGGRNPLIFQTRGISQLAYVGPPLVWRTSPVSREYGALNEYCIQVVGDLVYFLSAAGFCVTDGVSVTRLGEGRVDNYVAQFIGSLAPGFIRSAHVERDGAVYWLFEGLTGSDDDPIIGYSYRTNRFFRISSGQTAANCIAGWTVQQTTSSSAAGKPTLRSDGRLLVATNNTIKVGALKGSNLAAEVTTGYTALTPGRRVAINNVEPVYDGSGAKVAVNTKATQAGAVTTGTPVAVNSDGIADLRADGRLAAVSVTFDAAATWSELKGVVVTADVSGAR